MASHLTVTSTNALGVSASKGLNGQAAAGEAAEGGIMGVFAALLGGAATANAAAGEAVRASQAELELSLGNLINLSFGFGEGGQSDTENPDALAAVINAITPIDTALQPAPLAADLTAMLDGLVALKASLDAGETPDPELLKQLEASLDALADALDIDLGELPDLAALGEFVATLLPEQTAQPHVQVTAALTPLVEALSGGSAATPASAGAELAAMVKSVGDKLAGLLRALNSGEVSAEAMAALGLNADTEIDPELDAAIQRLLATLPKADATASIATPELAAPALKLTETVLTGKSEAGDEASSAAPTGTAPKPVAAETAQAVTPVAPDAAPEQEPAEREPIQAVAAPATPVEDMPDTQASSLTQHQASRVDAAAAPRVVQAGYQTSQQQLNLPQIAFELVRQVNDGNTRFQIRLDPPELGRIDVRLDIDAGGKVNARLTVERAETLDLMQRDQRGLERALQQAGLDGAKTNLEFSLKQNPFSQGGQQQGRGDQGRQPGLPPVADETLDPPPTVNLYRGSLVASGVNIIA